MTRLLIHVEGETEEAFVNEVRGKIGTKGVVVCLSSYLKTKTLKVTQI